MPRVAFAGWSPSLSDVHGSFLRVFTARANDIPVSGRTTPDLPTHPLEGTWVTPLLGNYEGSF